MTRLFLLLYVGVLTTLFAAWYLYGQVYEYRRRADRASVFEAAHGGGARMVASELANSEGPQRDTVLQELQVLFSYPLRIVPASKFPAALQRRLAAGLEVAYVQRPAETVVASLDDGENVVQLGPFPDYSYQAIEDSLAGWIRLTQNKVQAVSADDRPSVLAELRQQFDVPIQIIGLEAMPDWPRNRMQQGQQVAFYGEAGRAYAVAPIGPDATFLRFGPFRQWAEIERPAATTTLALVLLPTALVIALLLRPVAQQLRRLEHAAKSIAAGDLTTRVDAGRARSAQPLAEAFNQMAQRTETLIRTQRELLQAVSHELRTPLSRMRFAIDLVETAQDDTERRERLDAIDTAAEELDELVGELLRYVRLENAAPELEFEAIPLQPTLQSVIDKRAETHPAIAFTIQPVTSSIVLDVDRLGFERVMSNLIHNAAKFAQRQVQLHVSEDSGQTEICVDDDGPGIPSEDRRRVFEPFLRLHAGHGSAADGFGLGLALVKRIVEQHGGCVEVGESSLGGCRVRTVWPHRP